MTFITFLNVIMSKINYELFFTLPSLSNFTVLINSYFFLNSMLLTEILLSWYEKRMWTLGENFEFHSCTVSDSTQLIFLAFHLTKLSNFFCFIKKIQVFLLNLSYRDETSQKDMKRVICATSTLFFVDRIK